MLRMVKLDAGGQRCVSPLALLPLSGPHIIHLILQENSQPILCKIMSVETIVDRRVESFRKAQKQEVQTIRQSQKAPQHIVSCPSTFVASL